MFFRRKKLKNGFVTLETRPRETTANSCGMPCLFIIFQNTEETFLKHMPNKRRKKMVIFCSLPSLWDRFVLDICQEQVHIFLMVGIKRKIAYLFQQDITPWTVWFTCLTHEVPHELRLGKYICGRNWPTDREKELFKPCKNSGSVALSIFQNWKVLGVNVFEGDYTTRAGQGFFRWCHRGPIWQFKGQFLCFSIKQPGENPHLQSTWLAF